MFSKGRLENVCPERRSREDLLLDIKADLPARTRTVSFTCNLHLDDPVTVLLRVMNFCK